MRPWPVIALVVVGNAAVQALLVITDPVPAATLGFALGTVASVAALLVAVWFLAVLAVDVADAVGVVGPVYAVEHRWRPPWRRPSVLGWAAALAVVAVGLSLLSPLLVPLVFVTAGPVLVAGRAAPAVLRRVPVRSALLLLGGTILAALSWAGALLAGFFVGGTVAAFVTWLWFGAVAAFLLWRWAALARRTSSPAHGAPAEDLRAAGSEPGKMT